MSDLSALTAGTWNVDPSHSTVGFTARHLMITKVRGSFKTFTGSITVAADPLQSKVEATVEVDSVDTGDANRDGHLKSGDFFELEKYPAMKLVSTGIAAKGSNYVMNADLTIKGVTKPVQFDLEFDGVNTDPWGNVKAGFTASTEINRKDWGMEWNAVLETGGVVVSEKIALTLDIQAVRA
jgi:polyisoprenoid-binding protein YceI